MDRLKISLKSLNRDSFEIQLPGATGAAEYLPTNKCLLLHIEDQVTIDRITMDDELIILEYSGSTSTVENSAPYCRTNNDDTTIETDQIRVDTPDTLINVYKGSAMSMNLEGGIFFSVDDDISSLLVDNKVVYEYVVGETYKRYHYARYFIRRSYYSIPLSLSTKNDYVGMNLESNMNEILSEAKENLVPGFLDLEKLKFSPIYVIGSGDTATYERVSKLVFRFSFLHRDAWTKIYKDTSNTNEFNYARSNSWGIDNFGWYTDIYSGDTTVTVPKSSKDGTATLLGYLGFTDDDIRYQKNKLSKSFARLSYYSTNDLLTNSLLNFSTIFVDGGELFGKYVRKVRNGEYIPDLYDDQELSQYRYSMASGDTRLDCSLVATDEYDETKSGEGFNIYLFADDFSDATESEPKTIYMKVEFNHAGFGKVLQMMRPRDDSKLPGDVYEYADAVFIPISVFYQPTMQKFVYTFDNDAVDYEDGVIYIDLYEATITKQNVGKNLC